MAGRGIAARSMPHIQPIWSTSKAEARNRVIKLYKTWMRQIPHIGIHCLPLLNNVLSFLNWFLITTQ